MKEKIAGMLRLSRGECLLIFACVCFCFFLLGYVFGSGRGVQTVVVETQKQPSTASVETPGEAAAAQIPAGSAEVSLVNINTAGIEQLVTLKGIGEVLAQRIIDHREEHGSFKSIYELTDVEGIGDQKLSDIIDYITVG